MRSALLTSSLSGALRRAKRPAHSISPIALATRTMATDALGLTAPPADKQIIVDQGVRYTTVKEGLAYILVPEPSEEDKTNSKDGQGVQQVFYNPIQQFNRDLTILAIKAYGKERLENQQVAKESFCNKIAEKKRKRKEQTYTERRAKAACLHQGRAPGQTVDGTTSPAPPTETESQGNTGAETEPPNTETTETTEIAETKAETEIGPPDVAPQATEPPTGPSTTEAQDLVPAEAAPGPEQAQTASADQDAKVSTTDSTDAAARPKYPNEHERSPPKFTILDALSASGLRALRYAHEIPFVSRVVSNDLLKAAVDTIIRNVQHNGLEHKIEVSYDDALAHMYSVVIDELRYKATRGEKGIKSGKYDVVDLDPYGTAAPFLDAAVQCVRDDGGLLCVTCTDSGVWASNGYPEKCFSLYGGIPLKGWYSHEVGLRIILHAIETSAAKYGLSMEPLLSLSIDYYTRVFVKIRKSPARVKFQGGKNMISYNCDQGCGAWSTQLLMKNKPAANKKGSGIFYKHGMAAAPTVNKACEHCGSTMHLAGPMYGGRIHSPTFIKSILAQVSEADPNVYGTTDRIRGMLQTALEEILLTPAEMQALEAKDESGQNAKQKKREAEEADLAAIDPYPFYFHPSHLAGSMQCEAPPERFFKGALRGLGYRVTRSHTKAGSMKTDAPWSILWHVMREWIRQKAPVKEANIKLGSTPYRLLRMGEKKQAASEPGAETNGTGLVAKEAEREKMPEVVFDEELGRDVEKEKLVRYQMNPRENWGPMSRAKGR